jgi:hypothetical protein
MADLAGEGAATEERTLGAGTNSVVQELGDSGSQAGAVAIAAGAVWAAVSNLVTKLHHNHHARGARPVLIAPTPARRPAGALGWYNKLTGASDPNSLTPVASTSGPTGT